MNTLSSRPFSFFFKSSSTHAMHKLTITLLCWIISTFLSFSLKAQSLDKVSEDDIYTHVINEFTVPLSDDSRRNMVVVSSRAGSLSIKRAFKDERLKRLARKSRFQWFGKRIRPEKLHNAKNFKVLKSAAIDRFFQDGVGSGWKTFYEQYPRAIGIISVSRPIFSRKDGLAMIYVSHRGGPLFGSGELWVIALGEELKTIQVFPLWIS